jgi:hypothetical protein
MADRRRPARVCDAAAGLRRGAFYGLAKLWAGPRHSAPTAGFRRAETWLALSPARARYTNFNQWRARYHHLDRVYGDDTMEVGHHPRNFGAGLIGLIFRLLF